MEMPMSYQRPAAIYTRKSNFASTKKATDSLKFNGYLRVPFNILATRRGEIRNFVLCSESKFFILI